MGGRAGGCCLRYKHERLVDEHVDEEQREAAEGNGERVDVDAVRHGGLGLCLNAGRQHAEALREVGGRHLVYKVAV